MRARTSGTHISYLTPTLLVTLGTLTQEPFHAVTGYLALVTLFLFLVGLALLPNAAHVDLRPGSALQRRPRADVQGSHRA